MGRTWIEVYWMYKVQAKENIETQRHEVWNNLVDYQR